MDVVNQTGLAADWTHGFQPDGRERLVVVIKATYHIPSDGVALRLAGEQAPLVTADEYWGEPGLSAPRYESDYAHYKRRCDVLLNGTAYVPRGRERRRVHVSLRVGSVSKAFAVVGDRKWWRIPLLGARPGRPKPFLTKPITYDHAFGGVDASKGEKKIRSFVANPVGRGFRRYMKGVHGQPLPNTEELRKPIRSPRRRYGPMGLGPIGRNWQPRAALAGTYDQKWLETRVPFFPDDFDELHFQAAPPDQQIPYPRGGERVELENLSADGSIAFNLPSDLYMPVLFVRPDGSEESVDANVDTILIEPDARRLCLTWRAVLPLRRNCFEIYEVLVGEMTPAQRRARQAGNKTYYPSLAELVAGRSASA
ncbi:MAG TPA: DUF2169 domain-containing protein [Myxococcota bacterium]|nr:DUF2169 domain-containing protein [Myxococcota bacterium]